MTTALQHQILIWAMVLIAVASLGLLGIGKSRRPLLYPGLLIFVLYFMGYGLPSLRFGLWGPPKTGLYQWPDLPSGLAFVSLFLLFLWSGFFLGPKFLEIFQQNKFITAEGQREWSFHPQLGKVPLLMSIAAFVVFLCTNYYAGGILFKARSIWVAGIYHPHMLFVTRVGILISGALFLPATFLAGMLWGKTKNPTLFLSPLLNILWFAAASTSRGTFTPIAYFFAAAYLATLDPLKVKKHLVLASCLVILGLIMMLSVRHGGWGHATAALSSSGQATKTFEQGTGGDAISSLSYAVYFHGLGYGHMGFFKWLFSMLPLPSFLGIGWTPDYAYSVSFASILKRGIGASGWPCPANAELYLQMGWLGALVGLPIGMGLAKLWKALEYDEIIKPSPLMILFYVCVMEGFVTAFHSPSRTCTRFFIYCWVLWMVLRVFNLIIPVAGNIQPKGKDYDAKLSTLRNKYLIKHPLRKFY